MGGGLVAARLTHDRSGGALNHLWQCGLSIDELATLGLTLRRRRPGLCSWPRRVCRA